MQLTTQIPLAEWTLSRAELEVQDVTVRWRWRERCGYWVESGEVAAMEGAEHVGLGAGARGIQAHTETGCTGCTRKVMKSKGD